MLKHLQTHANKAADASFKVESQTVRGRLVQKDFATKSAVSPTSQEGLYFVNRDNIPTGLMSLEGELDDYDPRYEVIQAGEFAVLEKPMSGERYATSEYVATGLTAGDYLIVSVAVDDDQGKFKKNASATPFKYGGTKVEDGHTLAIVEII